MCGPFVSKGERKKVAKDFAVVAGEDCNPSLAPHSLPAQVLNHLHEELCLLLVLLSQ